MRAISARALLRLSCAYIVWAPMPLLAQASPPQAKAVPEETTGITDIIVTARRRAENVQNLPLAVTALDSNTLEKSGITSVLDVAAVTPGVTMTEFNIGEPQTYIRGVGSQTDSAASESSVTVSMDEVPIGRGGASSAAFLDINRVEVLRGPQGTLYGKNASAGTMSYYSNRPQNSFSASVEASAGSFDTFGGKAMVNIPLSEGVAVRAAGQYSHSDGYAKNLATGLGLQGGERYAGRASIMAQRGNLTFLLAADYSKDNLTGDSRYLTPTPATNPYFVGLINAAQAGHSVWESAGDPGTFQRRRNYGVSGRIEYDADWMTVTSLSSYRNNRYALNADYTGIAVPDFPLHVNDGVDEAFDQFSQELRFNSASGAKIQWVAGLFYYTDATDRAERFIVSARAPFPAVLGGDNTATQNAHSSSYAAFGQLTVPFASIWELTLGGRITHDKKSVFQQTIHNAPAGQGLGFPFYPGSLYAVPAEASFTKPTWRASLSVEPAPGKRIYVSYDRGYKSGSFTSQAQNAAQAAFLVKPEQIDSFNAGIKTQWLHNTLRLNADAYYIAYKDLQVFEFGDSLNFVLANADATIKGFEIQMLAAPSRHFNAGANFSYMDAIFDSNPSYAGAVLPYKGNRLSRAPKYKVSTFVEANADVAHGQLLGRVSYDFQSDYFYNPSNDVASLQKSYGVLGAYASWESADGLKFSVTADNLTNTKYSVHHISVQAFAMRIYAPPRSFTFTVAKKF